jgi:3-deoxy-D-manno-octulosonate 8-phosphate phosphatase (KDO 8-P phosphatase)
MKRSIKLLILDVDGTMTDAGVYITEKGEQFKKFNARDGIGIKEAMKSGIEVGIISHSMITEMVSERAHIKRTKYVYIGQETKEKILTQWMDELNISPENVAFIGDDINDLSIIKLAGFTACPADAVPKVKEKVDVILNLKGGEGCVREFIDNYLLSD